MYAKTLVNRFKFKIRSLRSMVLESISHGSLATNDNCSRTEIKPKIRKTGIGNSGLESFEVCI